MQDLKGLGVDYLLVNTTNKFLLEYAPIEENSCHKLTGFTGDTGDSLLCSDGSAILFVDGRYHAQADKEVNHSKVSVYKLRLGQKQDDAICESIKPNSTLGIVPEKVSQKRYEYLKTLLKEINVSIKFVEDIFVSSSVVRKNNAEVIPHKYTGKTFKEKLSEFSKPVLLTNSEEISYLCNIRDFNQNYAVKVDGKLLITKDKAILFTDTEINGQVEYEIRPLKDFDEVILNQTEPINVDKGTINAYDYSLIKNPISEISPIKKMKSLKNDAEIEHLKYCFSMTDKALFETRKFIENNDNLSEYDIDEELSKNFKKYGAKLLSFKSIVARNQNSALAHYMKSSKDEVVKDGDLILIDCGAYYEGGLATDITRVFVKGNPSQLHKKVYTTVLKMFLNAFNYNVVEGTTTGYEIDGFTREYLKKNEIEGFAFSHGLGHGLGVCVHEAPPNLSMNEVAKHPIFHNMCFTIEPGLYNDKEFGVRLENSCYLKNGVIESFSNMCYEKKLIEFSMLSEQEKEWLKKFRVL